MVNGDIPGQVVLGWIRKKAKQASRNKQCLSMVSASVPVYRCLLEFLP